MRPALWLVVLCVACDRPAIEAATAQSSGTPPAASSAAPVAVPDASSPPSRNTYLGREIAQTMSHEGAPWLVRPERDAEENTTLLLRELRLTNGQVACDFGAGNGYHALRMAKAVAPKGRVIAIDIQREMLDKLAARAKEAGITNVKTVLAEPDDPTLAAGACDLILLVDVYHELSKPSVVLLKLKKALSKKGVLALVEFRAEDDSVPIKPLHKMSKMQMLKELGANGYELARSFDGLPWQHLMFFRPKGRP